MTIVTRELRRLQARLGREEGQNTLEVIISLGVWWVSVLIFLNVFIVLAAATITQTTLTRTALQAASFGCLTGQARTDFVNRDVGFGASDFQLDAHSPNNQRGYGLPADPLGSGWHDASCGVGDHETIVANSRYIWLRVRYTQHLAILPGLSPEVPMQRTALVVSNSLHGDPPGT